MRNSNVVTLFARLIAAAVLPAAAFSWAQTKPAGLPGGYPNKPIRVIVPASPGGGTDIISRIVAQRLAERWSTAVVIENRGSAVGGIIGMDIAAKTTPDGYTLLAVSASRLVRLARAFWHAGQHRAGAEPRGRADTAITRDDRKICRRRLGTRARHARTTARSLQSRHRKMDPIVRADESKIMNKNK